MRRLVPVAALIVGLAAAAPASAATFFHSPSGNIRCVIDRTAFTRCDITNRNWSPPPKPRSCEFDCVNLRNGHGFAVSRQLVRRF
jgi:hypothetical protein